MHPVFARLFVLLLALSACALDAIGELTPEQCTDGEDNDNDNMTDCEDPGCLSISVCRDASFAAPFDSSVPQTADARMPPTTRDSAPPPAVDASAPQDAMVPTNDVTTCPTVPCLSGQLCLSGTCVPAPTLPGSFSLQVLSAQVPSKNPNTSLCYDPCTIPAGVCTSLCYPDPYVEVTRIRDGSDLEVGTTEVVRDTVAPRFLSTPTFSVDLEVGDELQFAVFDSDIGLPPTLLFTCSLIFEAVNDDSILCVDEANTVVSSLVALE